MKTGFEKIKNFEENFQLHKAGIGEQIMVSIENVKQGTSKIEGKGSFKNF